MYQIDFRQTAKDDAGAAYEYYEEIMLGLGDRFLQELETLISSLKINSEAHSYLNKPLRQSAIKTVPLCCRV